MRGPVPCAYPGAAGGEGAARRRLPDAYLPANVGTRYHFTATSEPPTSQTPH